MGLFTVENETCGQLQQPLARSAWNRRNPRCHNGRTCARPVSTRSETSVMSTAEYVSDVGYLSSSDTWISDSNARDLCCCVFSSSRQQTRKLFRGVLVGRQDEMTSAPQDQSGARQKTAAVAVDVTELDCRRTKEKRMRTITETRISLRFDENDVWTCSTKNSPRKPTTATVHMKGASDNARSCKTEPAVSRRSVIPRELDTKGCLKESQRKKFSSLCRFNSPGSRRKVPCRSKSDISSLLSYTNKNESHYMNASDIAATNRTIKPQPQRFGTTTDALGLETSAQRAAKVKAFRLTPSLSTAARRIGQRNTPTFVEVNREPSGATKPVINVLHTQCNKWFSQQKSKNPASTALVKKAALNCIAYKPSANEVPPTPEFRIPDSSRPVQKTSIVASRPEHLAARRGVSLLPSDDDVPQFNALSRKRRGTTLAAVNQAARPRKQPSSAQEKQSNEPNRKRGNSGGSQFVGLCSESSSSSSNRVPIQKVKQVGDRRTSENAKNGPVSGECNDAGRRHSLVLHQRYLRTSETSTTSSSEIKTGDTKGNAKTAGTKDAASSDNVEDVKLDNGGVSLLEKYTTSLSFGTPMASAEKRNIILPSILNKNSSILTNVTWLPVNNRGKWGSFQKEAEVKVSSSISSHSQPPADKSPLYLSKPKVASEEVRAHQPSEASQYNSLDNSSRLCTSSESSLDCNLINNLIACHRMVVQKEAAQNPELKKISQKEAIEGHSSQVNDTFAKEITVHDYAKYELDSKIHMKKQNPDEDNVIHKEASVARERVSTRLEESEPSGVKSSFNVKINTELNEIVKSVLNFLKDSQNDPQTNVPGEHCNVLSCKQSPHVIQTTNGTPWTEPLHAVLAAHGHSITEQPNTPNESSSTSESSSLSLEIGSGALQAKIIRSLHLQSLAKSMASKTMESSDQRGENLKTQICVKNEEANADTSQIDSMFHIAANSLLVQQTPNVAPSVVNKPGSRVFKLSVKSPPENAATIPIECEIQTQAFKNTACEPGITGEVLKQSFNVDNKNYIDDFKMTSDSDARQKTEFHKNEVKQNDYETKDSSNAVELPLNAISFTSPKAASVKLMNFTENQRNDALISEKSANQTLQTRAQIQDFNSFENVNILPEEQHIGNFTAQFKRLKDVKRRLMSHKSDVFMTGSDTSIVTCSQTSQATPMSRYAPGRLTMNPGHNELDIKREKEKISCRCAAIHSILTDLKHHILLERISQYKYGSADQFMTDQVLSEDGRLSNEAIESQQSSTIERASSGRRRSPVERCSMIETSLYPFNRCRASDSKSSLEAFEPSASEVSESMKLIASVIKKNALGPHEVLRALGFQEGQLNNPRENHKTKRKSSDRNVFIENYCRQLIANWQRSQCTEPTRLSAELDWSPIKNENDTISHRLTLASLERPSPHMIGLGRGAEAETSPPYVFFKPKPCRPQASGYAPLLKDEDQQVTQVSGKEKRLAAADSAKVRKSVRSDASMEHNAEKSVKMKVSREDRSEKMSDVSESKKIKSLLEKFQTMTTKELLDFAMCHRGDDTLNRLIVREVYERASKKQDGSKNKSQLRQGAMQLFFLLSNRSITSKSESLESLLCPEKKSIVSPRAGQCMVAIDAHTDAAISEIRKQDTKRSATDQYSIMKAEFKERVKENQRIINQWSFSSFGKYKSGDISQGDETSLKNKLASASKAAIKQISPKNKDMGMAVNLEYLKDKTADVKKHQFKKYTFSSTSPKSVEQAKDVRIVERESVFKTIMSGDEHRRALKSDGSAPCKKTHGHVSKFTSPIIKMSDTKCTITDGVAVCYLKSSASCRGKELRVRDSKVSTISWKDDTCVVDDVRVETSKGSAQNPGSAHRYHLRPSGYVSTAAELFASQASKRPSKHSFVEMPKFRDKDPAGKVVSNASDNISIGHDGIMRHGALLQTIHEHETCDAETLTTPSSMNAWTEAICEERSRPSEWGSGIVKEDEKRFVDASANTEGGPDTGLCKGDRGSLQDVRPKLDRVSTASLTDMNIGDCKPVDETVKENVLKNAASGLVNEQTQSDKSEQCTEADVLTEMGQRNTAREEPLPLVTVIETKHVEGMGTEINVRCTEAITKQTQSAGTETELEENVAEDLMRHKAVKEGDLVMCGPTNSTEDEKRCHMFSSVSRLLYGDSQSEEPVEIKSQSEKVSNNGIVDEASNSSCTTQKMEFESGLGKDGADMTPDESASDNTAHIQVDNETSMVQIPDEPHKRCAVDNRQQDDSCEKKVYLEPEKGTANVADKESLNENIDISSDMNEYNIRPKKDDNITFLTEVVTPVNENIKIALDGVEGSMPEEDNHIIEVVSSANDNTQLALHNVDDNIPEEGVHVNDVASKVVLSVKENIQMSLGVGENNKMPEDGRLSHVAEDVSSQQDDITRSVSECHLTYDISEDTKLNVDDIDDRTFVVDVGREAGAARQRDVDNVIAVHEKINHNQLAMQADVTPMTYVAHVSEDESSESTIKADDHLQKPVFDSNNQTLAMELASKRRECLSDNHISFTQENVQTDTQLSVIKKTVPHMSNCEKSVTHLSTPQKSTTQLTNYEKPATQLSSTENSVVSTETSKLQTKQAESATEMNHGLEDKDSHFSEKSPDAELGAMREEKITKSSPYDTLLPGNEESVKRRCDNENSYPGKEDGLCIEEVTKVTSEETGEREKCSHSRETIRKAFENSQSSQINENLNRQLEKDCSCSRISIFGDADAVCLKELENENTSLDHCVKFSNDTGAVKTFTDESVVHKNNVDSVNACVGEIVTERRDEYLARTFIDDINTLDKDAGTVQTIDSHIETLIDVHTENTFISDNTSRKEEDTINTFKDDILIIENDANTVNTPKDDSKTQRKESHTVNTFKDDTVAVGKDIVTVETIKDDILILEKDTLIVDNTNMIRDTVSTFTADSVTIRKKVIDTIDRRKDTDNENKCKFDSLNRRENADTVKTYKDGGITRKTSTETANTLIDESAIRENYSDTVNTYLNDSVTRRREKNIGLTPSTGLCIDKNENVFKKTSLNTLCPTKPRQVGIVDSRDSDCLLKTSDSAISRPIKYNSDEKTSSVKELDIRNYFLDNSDSSKAAKDFVVSPCLLSGREIPRIVIENTDSDARDNPSENGKDDAVYSMNRCSTTQNRTDRSGTSKNITDVNSRIRNNALQLNTSTKLQAYFGEASDDASFPGVFSTHCEIISEEAPPRSTGTKSHEHKDLPRVQRSCERLPGLRTITNSCSTFGAQTGRNGAGSMKPERTANVNSVYSIVKNNSKKSDSQYPQSLDQRNTNYKYTDSWNLNPCVPRFQVSRVEPTPWKAQIELAEPVQNVMQTVEYTQCEVQIEIAETVQQVSATQNMMRTVEETIELSDPLQQISPTQNMVQLAESTPWEVQIDLSDPVQQISPSQHIVQFPDSTPWEVQIELSDPVQQISPSQHMVRFPDSTPWEVQIELSDPVQQISPTKHMMQFAESTPWEVQIELADPVMKIHPSQNMMQTVESTQCADQLADHVQQISPLQNMKQSTERVYNENVTYETGNNCLADVSVKQEVIQETVIIIEDEDAGDNPKADPVEFNVSLPREQKDVSYCNIFDQTLTQIYFNKPQLSHTDLTVLHSMGQDDRCGPVFSGMSHPAAQTQYVNPLVQSCFVPIPPDTNQDSPLDCEIQAQQAAAMNSAEDNFPNCPAQALDQHPHWAQNDVSYEMMVDTNPNGHSQPASEILTTKDCCFSINSTSCEWRHRCDESESRPKPRDSNSADKSKHVHYVSPLIQEGQDSRGESLQFGIPQSQDQLNANGQQVNRVPPIDIHGCLVNKNHRTSSQSCFTHEINPGLRQNHPDTADWNGYHDEARLLERKDKMLVASNQPKHVVHFQEEMPMTDSVFFHSNTLNVTGAHSSDPCNNQFDPAIARNLQGQRIISLDTAQHHSNNAPIHTNLGCAMFTYDPQVNSATATDGHNFSQINQNTSMSPDNVPNHQPTSAGHVISRVNPNINSPDGHLRRTDESSLTCDPSTKRGAPYVYDSRIYQSYNSISQEDSPGLNNASVRFENYTEANAANIGQTFLAQVHGGSRVNQTPSNTDTTHECGDKPDSCDTSQLINMHSSSFSVLHTSLSSSMALSELVSRNGQAASAADESSDIGTRTDLTNVPSDLNGQNDRTVLTASFQGHVNLSDDLKIQAASSNAPASVLHRDYQTGEHADPFGHRVPTLAAGIHLSTNDTVYTKMFSSEDYSSCHLLLDNSLHRQSDLKMSVNASSMYTTHSEGVNTLNSPAGANSSLGRPISHVTSVDRQVGHLGQTGVSDTNKRHMASSNEPAYLVNGMDSCITNINQINPMATIVKQTSPISQAGLTMLNDDTVCQNMTVNEDISCVTVIPEPKLVTVNPDPRAVIVNVDPTVVTVNPDPMTISVNLNPKAVTAGGYPTAVMVSPDLRVIPDSKTVKTLADPRAITVTPVSTDVTFTEDPRSLKVTPDPTAMTTSADPRAMTVITDPRALTVCGDPRWVNPDPKAETISAGARSVMVNKDPRAVTYNADPIHASAYGSLACGPALTSIDQSYHLDSSSTYYDCEERIGPAKAPQPIEMNQTIRSNEQISQLTHVGLTITQSEETNRSDSVSGQTARSTDPSSTLELYQTHATSNAIHCSVTNEAKTNIDNGMPSTVEPRQTMCCQDERIGPNNLQIDLMNLPQHDPQLHMSAVVNRIDILPRQSLELHMSQALTEPKLLPEQGPQLGMFSQSNILPEKATQQHVGSTVNRSNINVASSPEHGPQPHVTSTVNQPNIDVASSFEHGPRQHVASTMNQPSFNVAGSPEHSPQPHVTATVNQPSFNVAGSPEHSPQHHIPSLVSPKLHVSPLMNQTSINVVGLPEQAPQTHVSPTVNQPNLMGQAGILDYVKQILQTNQLAGEGEPFNSSMCFFILPQGVGALGTTGVVTALGQREEQCHVVSPPAPSNTDSTCPASGETSRQVTEITSDIITAPAYDVTLRETLETAVGQSAGRLPIISNTETEQELAKEIHSSKSDDTDMPSQSQAFSKAEIERNLVNKSPPSSDNAAPRAIDKHAKVNSCITNQEETPGLKGSSILSPSRHDCQNIDTSKDRVGDHCQSIVQNDSSGIEVKPTNLVHPGEKAATSPPRTVDVRRNAISEDGRQSYKSSRLRELPARPDSSSAGHIKVQCKVNDDNSLSNLSAREINTENEASSLVASLELPPVREESAPDLFESTESHLSPVDRDLESADSTPEVLGKDASRMSDKDLIPPQVTPPISVSSSPRSTHQWKHAQDSGERKKSSFESQRTLGKSGINFIEQSREIKGGRLQCGEVKSPEKRGNESSVSGSRGAFPSNKSTTPICGVVKPSASPPELVSTGPLSSDARAFFMEMAQKRSNARKGAEDFKIAEGTVRQKVERLLSGGVSVKEMIKQRSAPDPKTKEQTAALKYAEQVIMDFEKAAAVSSPDSSPNSPSSQSPSKVADLKKIFLGSTSPRNYSSQNDGELSKVAAAREELKTQSEGAPWGAKGAFTAVSDSKSNRVSITKPNSPQKTYAPRPLPSGDALVVGGDQRPFKPPNRVNNCKGAAPGESEGQSRFLKQKQISTQKVYMTCNQTVASTKESVSMPARQTWQESQKNGANPNADLTSDPVPLKRKTRSVPVVCAPKGCDKTADRPAVSQQLGSETSSPAKAKYPAGRQEKIPLSSLSKVRFTNKSDGAMDGAATRKDRSSSVHRSPIKSKRPAEEDLTKSNSYKKGGKETEIDRSSWKTACSKNSDSSESDSGSLSSSPSLEINRLSLVKRNIKVPSSASLPDDSEDGSFASLQSTPSSGVGDRLPRRDDNVYVINNDYLFLSCSNTACLRGVSESSSDLTIKSTFPINGEDSSSADEMDSGAEASETGQGQVRRLDSTTFSDSFHSCTSAMSHND